MPNKPKKYKGKLPPGYSSVGEPAPVMRQTPINQYNLDDYYAAETKRQLRAQHVKDFGTTAAIMGTQFRRPTQAELEQGRSGPRGQANILAKSAAWGLTDVIGGGLMDAAIPAATRFAQRGAKTLYPTPEDFMTRLKEYNHPGTSSARVRELDQLLADDYYGPGEMISVTEKRNIAREKLGKPPLEMGGYLPEYGFGSWLKDNASGLLSGAGSLVSMIPGVGQIAGPILNVAGSVVDSVQQQKAMDEQQALLDEQAAEQKKVQDAADRATRSQNIIDDKQIDYGPSFMEMGGQIGVGLMNNNPQIIDYTNGNTHQEGIGGIPVDSMGNPSTTSKQSAVGLTERGEVTWNGYVFSDKLKLD